MTVCEHEKAMELIDDIKGEIIDGMNFLRSPADIDATYQALCNAQDKSNLLKSLLQKTHIEYEYESDKEAEDGKTD